MVLVLLQALEAALRVEPTLPDRLRDWVPLGQAHVMRQVLTLAYGQPKSRKRRRAS